MLCSFISFPHVIDLICIISLEEDPSTVETQTNNGLQETCSSLKRLEVPGTFCQKVPNDTQCLSCSIVFSLNAGKESSLEL